MLNEWKTKKKPKTRKMEWVDRIKMWFRECKWMQAKRRTNRKNCVHLHKRELNMIVNVNTNVNGEWECQSSLSRMTLCSKNISNILLLTLLTKYKIAFINIKSIHPVRFYFVCVSFCRWRFTRPNTDYILSVCLSQHKCTSIWYLIEYNNCTCQLFAMVAFVNWSQRILTNTVYI